MPTGKPTKQKHCKLCGELFLPSCPSQKICNKNHYTKCPICGKDMIWNSSSEVIPCSKECKKERTRLRNLEKYGVDHPMKSKEVQHHHRQSMKEKYGVEHALQSDEIKSRAMETNEIKFGSRWALSNKEVRDKSKATMLSRYGAETTLESEELKTKCQTTIESKYGVSNAMQNLEVREKAKLTNLNRYGVVNPMQNPEIASKVSATRLELMQSEYKDVYLDKSRTTCLQHYGVENPSQSTEVVDRITETFLKKYGVKRAVHVPEFRQKMLDTMTQKYGVPYYFQIPGTSANRIRISKINEAFGELLSQHGIPYEFEFPLDSKSFDIHILGTNILLEINPTYTHNLIGNHWNKRGLPENYHKDKTTLAESKGYRCIHVFDWDNWEDIIKLVEPRSAIYARNCEIYHINPEYGNQFLRDNHLQSSCRGQSLYLGLVHDDELVELMTFGKSRYDHTHSIELLRLCSKSGVSVVGGASKLFKYAMNTYELSNIISYCDIAKFSGFVYKQIGMKELRITPPQEIWSKGTSKITANLLRQRGYDQLFGTHYGKDTNNEKLMLNNGWLPVMDCGQKVFEYIK